MKVFQRILPVAASSATTLPEKVQQGYSATVAMVSSDEDRGT